MDPDTAVIRLSDSVSVSSIYLSLTTCAAPAGGARRRMVLVCSGAPLTTWSWWATSCAWKLPDCPCSTVAWHDSLLCLLLTRCAVARAYVCVCASCHDACLLAGWREHEPHPERAWSRRERRTCHGVQVCSPSHMSWVRLSSASACIATDIKLLRFFLFLTAFIHRHGISSCEQNLVLTWPCCLQWQGVHQQLGRVCQCEVSQL